jgi:hypothetical protein
MSKTIMAKDAKVGKYYSLYGKNFGQLASIKMNEEWTSGDPQFCLVFTNGIKQCLDWAAPLVESDSQKVAWGGKRSRKSRSTRRKRRSTFRKRRNTRSRKSRN